MSHHVSFSEWSRRVARTGFWVSAVSYAVFWACDLARPGFVSRYFSVHVFLIAALAFGAWWTYVESNS